MKLGLSRRTLAQESERGDDDANSEKDINVHTEKVQFEDDDSGPKRFILKMEFPFSSELKRMSMIYLDRENEKQAFVVIKGAVSFFQNLLLVV